MPDFVKVEDLQHVKVPSNIHLWQVLEGQRESLTNSQNMKTMESWLGFTERSFWDEWLKKYNGRLPNGFYWIDHNAKTVNVVLSNTWVAAEYQLEQKGVVLTES
ncbi:hypothetical protein IQ260_25650 [Leptolyngbya cf. ectocarpi LEGE 11479]|uniref:Uncharacterized protein n=1 Tax=Leptolyngbya cf. ectocarpi LEGE 11479 TaxID=1828722 RepID=A0A928ZZ02_LEPEC|nr:hypothetical protein [Leptolyngbya ectocarpi]MBE9070031.1 hypothetical protein [Leptolyngbya cf. ectocarpi LEGE 11479]